MQCQFGSTVAAESKILEQAIDDAFQYKATSDVVEDHSYEPYLIDYHEDTNTFTYNDPWIKTDQANYSCYNVPIAHASVESTSASEVKCCDHIRDGHESNTSESKEEIAYCDVTAEHVPEVSFLIITNNNRRYADETPVIMPSIPCH